MWAYLNNLAVLMGINAILAVTLNFVLGYAGIFSMAHAVFFGVGAYTAALVAVKLGGGFLLATGAGMAVAVLISLALALPALWFRPEHWPSASAWGALIAVGVLCTGVAYILYFKLIESAGPARALTVTFLVPVFAIAYGVLFLGESVTAWMLLCGAVILAGTALSSGLVKLPGR